jgi:hypothetical protein
LERTGVLAANALVVARKTADGTMVARALSGQSGRYRVTIGRDSVELLVLRIGYEPTVLGRLRLDQGERREFDAVLPETPLRLSAVQTREAPRCQTRPDEGSVVARLFLQVRTALMTARLREQQGGVVAQYEVRNMRTGTRGQSLGAPQLSIVTDSSLQPFRSVPVDTLMQFGFRTVAADGAMSYRAPDADVLTSDQFLVNYCLQLAAESNENPAWVGVEFRPARSRTDIVQIRGVAWLDQSSSELRQIDFGYVGLEPTIARASPGGMIAYTRLDDDMWFIHEWGIRMPTVVNVTRVSPFANTGSQALDYATVSGAQTVSGTVLELRRGSELLFSSGSEDPRSAAILSGLLQTANPSVGRTQHDALLKAAVANRDSLSCGAIATVNGTIEGVVLNTVGRPVSGALVRAMWVEQLRSPVGSVWHTEDREEFTHTDMRGRYLICQLPRNRPIRITVTSVSGKAGDLGSSSFRFRRDAKSATMDWAIRDTKRADTP